MTDIQILEKLTPQLVEKITKDIHGAKAINQYAMVVARHGDLILASMRAALAWKREMEQTRGDEP